MKIVDVTAWRDGLVALDDEGHLWIGMAKEYSHEITWSTIPVPGPHMFQPATMSPLCRCDQCRARPTLVAPPEGKYVVHYIGPVLTECRTPMPTAFRYCACGHYLLVPHSECRFPRSDAF